MAQSEAREIATRACETIDVQSEWEEILSPSLRPRLEACLPAYLRKQRWLPGKAELKAVRIRDAVPLPGNSGRTVLMVLVAEFVQSESEEYLMPLAFASGEESAAIERDQPRSMLARLRIQDPASEGLLYDAATTPHLFEALLDAIVRRRSATGDDGELAPFSTPAIRALKHSNTPRASRINAEERNASAVFEDKFLLKLFRKLEPGENPEIESARFLASKEFPHVPLFAGALEYTRSGGERVSLALARQYIPAASDGWTFTLDALRRYFDRVRTFPHEARADTTGGSSMLELAEGELPGNVAELLGTYLEATRLLGQRTGQLHLALASDPENKDFAPEPVTPFYQRSLYQSFRNHLLHHFELLRRGLATLAEPDKKMAERVLGLQEAVLSRYRAIHETPMDAMRIRCHGDFHLGHVLHTGKDFVIIDFEGDPSRPMTERRIKLSPLRDVAGMIRSFSYAAHAALVQQLESGNLDPEQFRAAEPWARFWERWIGAAFLRSYLHTTRGSNLLPQSKKTLEILVNAFLLDKAAREMSYELNDRIGWLHIPLRGILQLIEPPKGP